jgi:hypothetical protein
MTDNFSSSVHQAASVQAVGGPTPPGASPSTNKGELFNSPTVIHYQHINGMNSVPNNRKGKYDQ